jgi:hypothetical protein
MLHTVFQQISAARFTANNSPFTAKQNGKEFFRHHWNGEIGRYQI